ncbi:transducin family protein / WD-40 repeat family protein [Zea mays]|uniref:Transducin family protein / WD-40 repeat family protein n=2 Tax=Zea mays TaxID=4577 RepID=A0A1D6HRR1_MAIZE|nr:transducin family protein / WD-40 repeat family protein [Zea mays]
MAEYRLGLQLHGHTDDVRGICVCGDAGIATSSRDRTVKFWTRNPEKESEYVLSKTLAGHSSFVGPLAWIPPSDRFPEGGIVSGGMDTFVFLWDLQKGEVAETMKGHSSQVTGLAVDTNGDIISSSMDCTVRRWRNGNAIEVWEAHKVAVQTVLKLPTGELFTDTVRFLASMPGLGILSASHDSTVKLWALSGQPLLDMIGHSSLVYSVDAHSSGLIASGSEDRSLKIWKDGVCVQSIEHPGCIWDAKFLGNGDIVTACSDGTTRIWTADSNRFCSDEEIAAYTDLISQYTLSRKTVGGLKLMDLPGVEALQVPGNSDGQTLIVREGDNGVAYSWNSAELKWDKIGEVVDGPGEAAQGQVHDGVRYDFVFNVDIGDGEPIRKLPYNRSDDPYTVADKWLLKENLPLTYRQQVVEFILQNSGQNNFVPDPSFRDPYTGALRFSYGVSSLAYPNVLGTKKALLLLLLLLHFYLLVAAADNQTDSVSANAYVPGQPSSSSNGNTPEPIFKHIPKSGMLSFETAQFDGILKKVAEFNSKLSSDSEQKQLSLSETEMSRLPAIVNVLKETSFYHTSKLADADMTLLVKILKSWPPQMMFPVIDFLRMFVLHPDGASLLLKTIETGNDILLETFRKAVASPVQPANLLTVLKAVTNLFGNSCLHQWLRTHCAEIIDSVSNCKSSFSKNAHLAYATLLLNYAVLSIESKEEQSQAQILSAALEIAEDDTQDFDSKYRALVAIGSLMLKGLVKSLALDLDVKSVASSAKSSMDQKIAEVGGDIESLTR